MEVIKVIKESGEIVSLFGLDCELPEFKEFISYLEENNKTHNYNFTDINQIEIAEISHQEWEKYCEELRYLKSIRNLAASYA